MAKTNSFFLYLVVLATLMFKLFSLFHSVAAQSNGIATFYTPPYVPSACTGYNDPGLMIAAASDELWNDGDACGTNYQVTCVSGTNAGTPHPCLGTGSTVTVTIVDYCPPPGCRGTLDLSQEAFAMIADTNAGGINIAYQQA